MIQKSTLKRGDRVTLTLKGVVRGEPVGPGERVMIELHHDDRWKRETMHVDWSAVTDVLPPVLGPGARAYAGDLGEVEIILHDPASASYVVRIVGAVASEPPRVIPDDASVIPADGGSEEASAVRGQVFRRPEPIGEGGYADAVQAADPLPGPPSLVDQS